MGWAAARECDRGVVFAMEDTISGCHVAGDSAVPNEKWTDRQVALPDEVDELARARLQPSQRQMHISRRHWVVDAGGRDARDVREEWKSGEEEVRRSGVISRVCWTE